MTVDEKEWLELKINEVAYKAAKQALAEHIKSCPYGKIIGRSKAFLLGMAFAFTLLGVGVGTTIVKLVKM